MAIDRRMRLAVPGHAPAEPLVEIGDRPRAGLGHAAADHQPIGVEAMHVHVALGPALEIGAIILGDRGRASVEAGARKVREMLVVGDPHAAAFEDLAVSRRPDEADRIAERVQRLDPRFAAGRDRRPKHRAAARYGASCCSTASAVRGALVMRTTQRPSLAPLSQPLGGARVKVHAVVDDAPDVAQDQAVFGVERIPEAHSRPASASACSIGATSSGLLSSRSANGGVATSTTATGMPAARKRNCSRPSSVSSSLTGVAT